MRVKIFGDVHGVGFRALTEHRARKLGLTGWVRNNPDGSVEIVFEGDDKKVRDMIEWCKQGPPAAYVERVNVEEEHFKGEFTEFSIIY